MRERWKVHRGWIKVRLAVDVKTKEIVATEFTDEGRRIEAPLGDGAFDRGEIFDHLQQKEIQPVIKTQSNSNTKARGSPARAKAVREMKDLGYQS